MEKHPLANLFAPLGREYCTWFYWLSIMGFILMTMLIISGLVMGIQKKLGGQFWFSLVWSASMYAVFYFQNRLLYSMCVTA
jgi:hypothetical protein